MAKGVTIEWLEGKIEAIDKTERFYGFISADMRTEREAYRMLHRALQIQDVTDDAIGQLRQLPETG